VKLDSELARPAMSSIRNIYCGVANKNKVKATRKTMISGKGEL